MAKFTFKPYESCCKPCERTISFDEHEGFRNIIRALAEEIDTDTSGQNRSDVSIFLSDADTNLLEVPGCEWFYDFTLLNRHWNDHIGRLECQYDFHLIAAFHCEEDRESAENAWKLMA